MPLPFMLALFAGLTDPSATGPSPRSVNQPTSIHIALRCYTPIPRAVLAPAQRAVARIYGAARVQVVWRGCVEGSELGPGRRAPGQPEGPSFNVTILILPRTMAERVESDEDMMGMTPAENIEHGRIAYVFYDRVDFYAHFFTANIGQVLGHAIAHEVGHLLLPYPSHSPTGLMRAAWVSKDFQDLARGWLLFTPDQAQLLRERLDRSRPEEQRAAEPSL
jgi:hypothetical protein